MAIERVTVNGRNQPPYEGAKAYVVRDGCYGIEYHDGYVDWLGDAHKAFGDDAQVSKAGDSNGD